MSGWSEELGSSSTDSLLASLTAGAQDRAESRVLDQLVGDWRVTTEWEPIVGQGVRHLEGRAETRWILEGRVLESRSFDADGVEIGKLLCAFDPTVGDYTAYAVHRLSTCFVLERGIHRPELRTLTFDGLEPVPGGRPSIHYRRTIDLRSDDEHVVSISYPGVPVGTYGPMVATHRRVG